MRLKFLAVLSVLIFSSFSYGQFRAEVGGGFISGGTSYKELGTGYTVNHTEVILSLGIELMAKVGFSLGNWGLSAAGFHDWEASALNYQASNQSIFSSGVYSVTNRKMGYGPSVSYAFDNSGFSLFGEYYPYVNNTFNWAETKSQNPFRTNDWFTGWGFGLGGGKMVGEHFKLQAMLRMLFFNKVSLNGVETSVPGTRIDSGSWTGAFIGGAYVF